MVGGWSDCIDRNYQLSPAKAAVHVRRPEHQHVQGSQREKANLCREAEADRARNRAGSAPVVRHLHAIFAEQYWRFEEEWGGGGGEEINGEFSHRWDRKYSIRCVETGAGEGQRRTVDAVGEEEPRKREGGGGERRKLSWEDETFAVFPRGHRISVEDPLQEGLWQGIGKSERRGGGDG